MSSLYVGSGNALQALQPVSLDEEALQEIKLRSKIQPHFLGEPLVVIGESEDFPQISRSGVHPTLLALDTRGQVVTVELKLGVARAAQPLMALRYASYVAQLSAEELGKIAHAFVNRPANIGILRAWQEANVEMSDEAVELTSLLATTFERDAEDFADVINRSQRLIIAAEGFESRMVELIAWLAANGADVRGLQYRKFMVGGQEIYFAEQVVPRIDPAVDASREHTGSAPEAEEPWRVRGLPYYIDRLVPAVGSQLEFLLTLIRPHTFSIDWSHKYYFLVRGARRNLRVRVYHRNRLDIGFFNATVEAASDFLARYNLGHFEPAVLGGYEKSPFVSTSSDTEFDDRWRAALGDWLSGAEAGATRPEVSAPDRRVVR
ncbi:MAG: hypothetical protein ACOCX4_08185 [Planctomycetota bacterium]